MTRRFLTLAMPLAAAMLAAGCRPETPGAGEGEGIISEYRPAAGVLRYGRSYRYDSIAQNTFTQQGGDFDPAISPDGKWLLFASTAHDRVPEIYMKSVNGATVTRLTNTTYAEIQPCFRPDGKYFAYATNRRGNWDICIERTEGSRGPIWVTLSMKSDEIAPCFHPTEPWIAFSTYNLRNDRWEIAVKNLKTGQTRYLGEGLYPKFNPGGTKIAFQRSRSREPRWYSIWTIDLDEELNVSSPTEVVSSAHWAAINPNWSPDGKYLAFATVHESPLAQGAKRILMGDDIWIVNLEGQDLVKLTDTEAPESSPVWSRDEKGRDRVYFCSMIKGPRNVWSLTPELPEPYGSVEGRPPGPKAKNRPPEAPREKSEADVPGALQTYLAPPPPAVSAGGSAEK